MEDEFQDKVVLVTGGSCGIGRAAAIGFARRGAKVVIADIDVARGEETLKSVKAIGSDTIFVETDVSSEKEVKDSLQMTIYGIQISQIS